MNKKNKLDFFDSWNSKIISSLRLRFDKNNMFKSIHDFKNQIINSFSIESKWYKQNKTIINDIISKGIDSVLICGMGGSAIGGEVARTMLFDDINIPISVNRSNNIPNWVSDKTLVIISSYSGNTYETIDSFNKSMEKTQNIIAISSKSGMINSLCLDNNYPIINIPSNLQPRCALGYISVIMILVFIRLNLIDSSRKIRNHIKEAIDELKHVDKMMKDYDSPVFSISHKIRDSIPIVYGTENFTSIAALRFKNQLQENAKMTAFHSNFPEINHNEIEGWNNKKNQFMVIWIKDPFLDTKSSKLISETFKLLDNLNIQQEVIALNNDKASSDNKIAALFKIIYFLDWVSYYTALLNNTNPILIKNIKHIKKSIQ